MKKLDDSQVASFDTEYVERGRRDAVRARIDLTCSTMISSSPHHGLAVSTPGLRRFHWRQRIFELFHEINV